MGRRMYIKPDKLKQIIQTATGENLMEVGDVIAIGPEVSFCKEGDKILFTSWGVDKVTIDGEDYFFVLESDEFILGKL